MSYRQYGIYLIPPPHLVYPISQSQQVLSAEFNAHTAGKFMVHCTIKGFFKLAQNTSIDEFIPKLDELFNSLQVFSTEITELYSNIEGLFGPSIVLLLKRTEALHKLHNDVWSIVRPYIAEDCVFSPIEGAGASFRPHITLGMADLPTEPGLFQQATALCQYIYVNLPRTNFICQDLQLIEFSSDNWNGPWWETLQYKQIKGWQLPNTIQE